MPIETHRRRLLKSSVAFTAGLAGCGKSADEIETPTLTTPSNPIPGSEYPDVEKWMTETEIGGKATNYKGKLWDRQGMDTVEVIPVQRVHWLPPAIVIDQGTTVSWTTYDSHNVDANPSEQLEISDYEFRSGDPRNAEKFEYQFDQAGLALYHCDPHLTHGMKGAIVVK